jgi:hypothetical protein
MKTKRRSLVRFLKRSRVLRTVAIKLVESDTAKKSEIHPALLEVVSFPLPAFCQVY